MSEYKMKPGKLGEKVIDTYKKIEGKFTDAFLNEDGSLKTGKAGQAATETYQKIEDAVVGGYRKIEGAFVETFLEKKDDSSSEEK